MESFLKALPHKISHVVLRRLAGSKGGRDLMEWLIQDAQGLLGIGAGSEVDSSGERAIFEQLRQIAGSQDQPVCVFDVGANQGQFLGLTKESLRGLPHEVHCFEPSPSTFKILRENAGDEANVIFNPFGLGQAAGEFDLFSDTAGSGLASLSKRRLDHFGIEFNRQERVQIRTLDEYCKERQIDRIDLLKLDVEGHELDVLNGGVQMFSERRIRMVTFEFGGCHIDSRTFFQDFYYFFHSHGMTGMFRILPSGSLQGIETYEESLEQFRTTNFLVLRDDLTQAP